MKEKTSKEIPCSNKKCRRILAKTDGIFIEPENERVFSKLLSHRKKRFNPLYCIHCHQITRWYGVFRFVDKTQISESRFCC
jgi:hypothetical protein